MKLRNAVGCRRRGRKHSFNSRHRTMVDGVWGPWIVTCSNCGTEKL